MFLNPRVFFVSLPSLAWLLSLTTLAWVAASWTWVFLTPIATGDSAVRQGSEPAKLLAERAAGFRLFGSGPDAAVAPAQPATSSLVVRGIYAAGGVGFAVLLLDGREIPAVTGAEFAPGWVLRRVWADRVEIARNGVVEVARMMSVPPMQAVDAAATPPALRLKVSNPRPGAYGLSRSELREALKQPDQLPLLGRFGPHPRGGAVLERSPAGGLPEQLGLLVGDVALSLNGKPLRGPGDVAWLYEQLTVNERVDLEIMRAGEKRHIELQVAP